MSWEPEAIEGVEAEEGEQAGGQPGFAFDSSGLRITAEDMSTPSADEPLKAAFGVCNIGEGGGEGTVYIYADDQYVTEWSIPWLEPNQCTAPDGDGYVHDLGSYPEGEHVFKVVADPPGPWSSELTDTISL